MNTRSFRTLLFLLCICNCNLNAQTRNNPQLFVDSVSAGSLFPKTGKVLGLYGPDREATDFTIIKTELFIHSTNKFYTNYSSIISDEMRKALEKLTSGTQISFKVTAVNSKEETIAVSGTFFIK